MTELQTLVNSGPAGLDRWLRQFEEGAQRPDGRMNGISEVAAFQARHQSSLEWAEIAMRAADLWPNLGTAERESALRPAMHLRAWFISRMGSRQGDRILDKKIILDWFMAELTLSMDVVKERIVRWQDAQVPIDARLPIDQVRELRRIKNRLDVVKLLAKCGELPAHSEVRRWLDIGSQLP